MLRRISRLVLIPAVLVAAACEGDDTVGPGDEDFIGSADITISGDLTDTYAGVAYFGETTDPETQEAAWVLSMPADTTGETAKLLSIVRLDTRPAAGSYTLNNIEGGDVQTGETGAVYTSSEGQDVVILVSTGGTLTVTESSADRMEGTFTIQVAGTAISGQTATDVTATISGSFSAPNRSVSYPVY